MTAVAAKPPFRITGWHVLAMTVAFFAVIIGVDTIFIVAAYRSFSGQVAANPYEAGIAFNKTLQQRKAEAALGWTATVSDVPAGAGAHVITLAFADKAGAPIEDLTVTGTLERPATDKGRHALTFKLVGPGLYRSAPIQAGGAWDLNAEARNGKGDLMEAQERLTWP